LQRLDLPLERAAPFGELGLAENLQPLSPIEQVARDGAQLRLSLVCFIMLSRWRGCSFMAGWFRLLLGELWWRSLPSLE
jgi:hypothetical protein